MRLLSFLLLFIFSLPSAAEKNASQMFSEALLAVETLTGKFEQRILDADGTELQLTDGKFKVKRPGYFFWEIDPPYEQLVVGTPQSLKVYDPDLEQMSVHNQSSLAGTPASLISGDVEAIARDYDVNRNSEGGRELFVLKQKDPQQGAFDTLTFTFDKKGKKLKLKAMAFVDKLGQTTEISISKLKMNRKLSDQQFVFEPPEGTDIIIDG